MKRRRRRRYRRGRMRMRKRMRREDLEELEEEEQQAASREEEGRRKKKQLFLVHARRGAKRILGARGVANRRLNINAWCSRDKSRTVFCSRGVEGRRALGPWRSIIVAAPVFVTLADAWQMVAGMCATIASGGTRKREIKILFFLVVAPQEFLSETMHCVPLRCIALHCVEIKREHLV
eukprot:1637421-Pyramimonas_sp.AAC.1